MGGGLALRPQRDPEPVVLARAVEDRVLARAEPARDAPELERRAQERPLQRAALLVVVAGPLRRGVRDEQVCIAWGASHVDRRREDAAEAPLALGGLEP